jgi:hypothetical protein
MLSAIPLVFCWLQDVTPSLPSLQPHLAAWKLLAEVCDLLFRTPDVATKVGILQDAIDRWHAACGSGTQVAALSRC